jgi:glutaminyl-peptide cyclotransferase
MRIAINYNQILYKTLQIFQTTFACLALISCTPIITNLDNFERFDGQRALELVNYQVDLGPRIPGSEAHEQIVEWIAMQIRDSGWVVEVQESTEKEVRIRNIIAKQTQTEEEPNTFIIIGAHYDSRIFADKDPDPANQTKPVPGANDGASGVAVLLELARVLPQDTRNQVRLVFFDAEDNGNIPGWDWILGSTAFVSRMEDLPEAVIIVDMIGDSDLNIYKELNSDPDLTDEIWEIAENLGYSDKFLPIPKYRILDDHVPFLEAGIPAVDIIDFDYPYWHTVEDTIDKVSAESLQAVGDTIYEWLLNTRP